MDIVWVIVIVEIASILLTDISSSPIWRCPDFKLIPCKTPPKQCTSYRMIYIRHVHLECPACLICADSLEPWSVQQSTSTDKHTRKRSKHHKERRKRARRRRRRLLQQQMLGVSASNFTTKHRNKNQNRKRSMRIHRQRKQGNSLVKMVLFDNE